MKEEILKEFDKFHKGIHKQGVCEFGQAKQFLSQAIDKTKKTLLEEEIKRLDKYDQLPIQVKLENKNYWEGYKHAKTDFIDHLKSLKDK